MRAGSKIRPTLRAVSARSRLAWRADLGRAGRGATLLVAMTLVLVPTVADSRLSVIPGRPGPRPTPTPQVIGSLSTCQEEIRTASAELAGDVHASFAACLGLSLPCLFDFAGSPSCCASVTPACAREADEIAAAGSRFVARVVSSSCSSVPFDRLLVEDGLDYARVMEACVRLDPPVDVNGLGSLATCLERLVTQDVLHLAAYTEQPRALEALVCMDLEDRFPGVLRDRPATCEELPEATAAPTPTPTPAASATPGASASPGSSPTPSGSPTPGGSPGGATPTPGGSSCTTLTVTLALQFSQIEFPDVSGATLMLAYPPSVDLPGFGSDASVLERVTNLSGIASGLFSVGDQDSSQDNVDDQLNVGLISLGTAIQPGNFARVRFDCVEGASAPTAAAFACTVDASDVLGNAVTAQCAVSVSTP